MPSMSYCVIENVGQDLGTMYDVIERLINEADPINQYEQRCLPHVINTMKEIIQMYEGAIEDGIIDKNGKLVEDSDDDSDDTVDMVARIVNKDDSDE